MERSEIRGPKNPRAQNSRITLRSIRATGITFSIHVHLQAFALDDLGEFRRLRLHEVGILLRRAPVGRRAHVADGLFDIIALQHRLDLLVERLDGGSGRGLRQEDAEPGGDVEVRKFGYALAYAW